MKKLTILLLVTALLTLSACSKVDKADLVILNGNILTIDKSNPVAEAIAIKGETIIEVGSTRRIERYIDKESTRVINAEKRLVLPGFNDAHAHFKPLDPDYIDFRYTTDPTVITEKVRLHVSRSKPGDVINGGNWDHEMFPDKKWPSKELIDGVSPDNPVILKRTDGHSSLVNSYILRRSGITKETPDPFGGEIQKDPVTGEPTGILKERAQRLIKAGGRRSGETAGQDDQRLREGYLLALQEAAALGITSIQIPGSADFQAYERLLQEGLLTCRIDIGKSLTGDLSRLSEYSQFSEKYPGTGNWIRFGYLKAFIDGTMGSGTALMYEPFNDNPSTSGLAMMSYEEFESMVSEADKRGFQIGVHAIGDKGNNWVLNAYERAIQINGRRNSRHRVEHSQTLAKTDIPRFSKLGVIPSMQPTHCISDKKFCEKRIGSDRCKGAYAWRSLAEAGSILAFGTDYPVEPLNPMEGLYAAVTRKERSGETGEGWFPEQKLSMTEAIEYYTIGSAYSQFMEDRKGMIRKGYLADIVIVDKNLPVIPETEIMTTKVDYTIVGGKVVYTSGK